MGIRKAGDARSHGCRGGDARAGRYRFDDRPRRRLRAVDGDAAERGRLRRRRAGRRRAAPQHLRGIRQGGRCACRRISIASRHFFPAISTATRLYGRGSCDAKGIAACQIAAVEKLRREGITNVGLLFVVGEERGSDGAKAAQALASGSKFLINGEPTDNRLGIGTRGALRYNLRAKGRAAHSSFPELGVSAIEKLIDALVMMRTMEMPDHPVLGRTHYTVGLIKGGVAPNVIPFEAEAEVMFRTVADVEGLRALMTQLTPLVTIEEILDVPPVIMPTRSRLRDRDVSLHDRHSVSLELGHAAALRPRLHPRRAHRQRACEDRGLEPRGRRLRDAREASSEHAPAPRS